MPRYKATWTVSGELSTPDWWDADTTPDPDSAADYFRESLYEEFGSGIAYSPDLKLTITEDE